MPSKKTKKKLKASEHKTSTETTKDATATRPLTSAAGSLSFNESGSIGELSKRALPSKMHPPERVDAERAEMDHNANCFVASIFDPFTYRGVRKPDLTMAPTAVYADNFKVNIPLRTNTDSTKSGGVQLRAMPKQQYQTLSVSASTAAFTWSSGFDSPNYSYMNTTFSAIRAVSMGIRFVNYGAVADRSCIAAVGLFNQETTNTDLTTILNAPTTRLLDITSGTNNFVWLPVNTVMHDGSQNLALLSEWHDPSLTTPELALIEQKIVLLYWTLSTTATPSDSIECEIIVNYEGIPLQAYKRNHDMKAAVGGQESTARSWRRAANSVGNQNNLLETIIDGGKKAGSYIAKQVIADPEGAMKFGKTVWAGAKKLGSQFLKTGLPLLGESLLLADEYSMIFNLCVAEGISISPRDPVLKKLGEMSLSDAVTEIQNLAASGYRSCWVDGELKFAADEPTALKRGWFSI